MEDVKAVAWLVSAGDGYERHLLLEQRDVHQMECELKANGWDDVSTTALVPESALAALRDIASRVAQQPSESVGVHGIRNLADHFDSIRSGLPDDWQDFAAEFSRDLRALVQESAAGDAPEYQHLLNMLGVQTHEEAAAEIGRLHAIAQQPARGGDKSASLALAAAEEQAEAWQAVCALVTELSPEWWSGQRSGQEKVLKAIRALAQPRTEQPADWYERRETHAREMGYAGLADALDDLEKRRAAAEQPAAKHWHDLYRAECRLRQDDAARYGQQITELEAAAEGPGEVVATAYVDRCGSHRALIDALSHGTPLYAGTPPRADVDDAMVERAFRVMRRFDCFFVFTDDGLRYVIRGWLTAAINPEKE